MMRSCVGTILAMIVVVLTLGLARAPDRSKSTVDLLQLLSDARATALKSESPYVPPQALLEDICVTATRIGGATAVKLIEEIAADYQRAKLPPTIDGQLGKIAAQVAPYDARARDRILTLAANELRAALKVENLWKAKPTPKGSIPYEDPQGFLDRHRQLIALRISLWEAVRQAADDPRAARSALERILADGRAKGNYTYHHPCTFEDALFDDLVKLDVELFLYVAARSERKARLPRWCAELVYRRCFDYPDDPFGKRLVAFAVEHGQTPLKPPQVRDNPNKDGGRPLTPAERKERGIPRSTIPEVVRILENPADTSWLQGEKRDEYHRGAAGVSYIETRDTKIALQLLANVKDDGQREVTIMNIAEMAAKYGDADNAIGLLPKIKNPSRFVLATCRVATALHERAKAQRP